MFVKAITQSSGSSSPTVFRSSASPGSGRSKSVDSPASSPLEFHILASRCASSFDLWRSEVDCTTVWRRSGSWLLNRVQSDAGSSVRERNFSHGTNMAKRRVAFLFNDVSSCHFLSEERAGNLPLVIFYVLRFLQDWTEISNNHWQRRFPLSPQDLLPLVAQAAPRFERDFDAVLGNPSIRFSTQLHKGHVLPKTEVF